MPKLNSLEVVHQDTNKDSYQTLHDILVDLKKSLALNQEVVDGDARASIENLLEMYVNDKEAFLRSVQTLTAKFKESQAQFSEEIFLLASQLEAQAKRTSMLVAQTESNMASVREYSEAVSSEVARKVSTYRQDTAPTGTLTYGDLWFDTDDNNRLYVWNGLVWVESSDTYNLNDFINTTYATDYAAIEAQVDSKAETWFQTTDPSTAWTTQPVRDQHDKDLWYNSSTKLLKVYVASTNTWTTVEDQAAVDAATAASNAQDTADGKITTFIQSTTPTAEGIGDLWMDTANNRQMKRWNGSSWVAVDDTRIATSYSRWGVQTTAIGGGKTAVAGIQLNADDTGTSEFTVLADNFRVFKSSVTSDPIFTTGSVGGVNKVVVNGNLVVTGSIVSNSVTVPAKFSFGTASGTGSTFNGSFVLPAAAYVSVLVTATQPNDNGVYQDNAGTGWVTGAANASTYYPASISTQYILTLDGTVIFNETPNNSFGVVTSFSASKQITSAGTKSFSLQVLPYGWSSFVNAGCIPRNIEVYILASMR